MKFLGWGLLIFLSTSFAATEWKGELSRSRSELIHQQNLQRKVLSALYQVNKNIKQIVLKKGSLQESRFQHEQSIFKINQSIRATEAQLSQAQTGLHERLRFIYKMKGQEFLIALSAPVSHFSRERNYKILKDLTQQDALHIKEYQQLQAQLKEQKEKLSNRLESSKILEKELLAEENKLRQEQTLKTKLLAGIRRKKMLTLQNRDKLMEFARNNQIAENEVEDLWLQDSFMDQKGKVDWPVQGSILQPYGLIKAEGHSYVLPHKGIFFTTNPQTAVKSVFDGKVAFVGDLTSFGKTIVVDHGDHYYTVYAHAATASVKVGDPIKKSQVIAMSGTSSFFQKDGIYFEIRHFSESYDPQEWMKGTPL